MASLCKTGRPPKQRLFALEVLIDGSGERVFKRAESADISLFERAKKKWHQRRAIDKFVPTEKIPVAGRTDSRPVCFGYKAYRDLFNPRQLLCLSLLAEAISKTENSAIREFMATAFSDSLAANNMFCFYAFDYQKLTPLFGLHAYHKVTRPVENNVWGSGVGRGTFEKCFYKLLRGKAYADAPYEYKYAALSGRPKQVITGESIKVETYNAMPRSPKSQFAVLLNQSSERLSNIKTCSIDLVLSDPPYYDNLAYSELSDFYHCVAATFATADVFT